MELADHRAAVAAVAPILAEAAAAHAAALAHLRASCPPDMSGAAFTATYDRFMAESGAGALADALDDVLALVDLPVWSPV